MAGNGTKALTWFGVSVVLLIGLIFSCTLASLAVSREGRGFFREMQRNADKLADAEKRPGDHVNADYNLLFNDDGTAAFSGGGLQLPLRRGWRVAAPPDVGEPRFEYYITSGDGAAVIKLCRGAPVSGYLGYDMTDRKVVFGYARSYAEAIGGEGVTDATPLAYVPPSALSKNLADNGVEGCYPYSPKMRAASGFGGEYFVFMGRGYDNLVVAAVMFKTFDRESARATGRELTAELLFN